MATSNTISTPSNPLLGLLPSDTTNNVANVLRFMQHYLFVAEETVGIPGDECRHGGYLILHSCIETLKALQPAVNPATEHSPLVTPPEAPGQPWLVDVPEDLIGADVLFCPTAGSANAIADHFEAAHTIWTASGKQGAGVDNDACSNSTVSYLSDRGQA